MNVEKIISTRKPVIFTKIFNKDNKIIPINKVKNTLGPVTHFPYANQEWSNSIYSYNNINVKNISNAQKNLIILIRSYFNFYLNSKLFFTKQIISKSKRLSINKILFSKAELKHTNDKVVITLYVYNEEKRILFNKLKRLETILFPYNTNISNLSNSDSMLFLSLGRKLDFLKKEGSLLV